MSSGKIYDPIVSQLIDYIASNNLQNAFETAVQSALAYGVPEVTVLGITDTNSFLDFANNLLKWVPEEDLEGKDIYYRLVVFYFIFNQPAFQSQQTPIVPQSAGEPLSFFSKWLVYYAINMGQFLDTTDSISAASLETFKESPKYRLNEYLQPRGGWKTFNEFFARNYKPGYRPIDALCDPTVIVSPTDSTFGGSWPIDDQSMVTLKGIPWSVKELLGASKYADQFSNGVFMHSFLNTFDYHRQHTPVEGTVLESFVIQGQAYLETEVIITKDGPPRLIAHRDLDAPDSPGYQFLQARGCIVIDSPIGLVAILPIGMAQVSSVIPTAEVGRQLRKGEEVAYFQLGGSDIVLVFQQQVKITAVLNQHYDVGNTIGTAVVPSQ